MEILMERNWTLTKVKHWLRERFLLLIESNSVFFIPPPLLKREFSYFNEEYKTNIPIKADMIREVWLCDLQFA